MNLYKMCIRTADTGLVRCSSGNASIREGNACLITNSGEWLENVKDSSSCTLLDLVTGNILAKQNTTGKPSSEKEIHRGIYRVRKDIKSILHFQSVSTTTIACYQQELPLKDFCIIPEISYYIKSISYVPYYKPGSKKLTEAVVKEFEKGSNLVIAKNHGIFTGGVDCDMTFQYASFFDLACSIITAL